MAEENWTQCRKDVYRIITGNAKQIENAATERGQLRVELEVLKKSVLTCQAECRGRAKEGRGNVVAIACAVLAAIAAVASALLSG